MYGFSQPHIKNIQNMYRHFSYYLINVALRFNNYKQSSDDLKARSLCKLSTPTPRYPYEIGSGNLPIFYQPIHHLYPSLFLSEPYLKFYFIYLLTYVCALTHVCYTAHVEVKGQLAALS